jgi:hypothetical protein
MAEFETCQSDEVAVGMKIVDRAQAAPPEGMIAAVDLGGRVNHCGRHSLAPLTAANWDWLTPPALHPQAHSYVSERVFEMISRRSLLILAGAASAVAVLGAPPAASAAPTPASTPASAAVDSVGDASSGLLAAPTPQLQNQIDAHMRMTPGAKQINQNQIALHDGTVILTLPMPGQRVARGSTEAIVPRGVPNCPNAHTCLYEDAKYEGWRLAYYDCAFKVLSGDYNDEVSSWHNNQPEPYWSKVYYWTGSAWQALWSEHPKQSNPYVGDAANDKADGIRPCFD